MKSNYEIAKEVIAGKWGNGTDRREQLTNAGYNCDDVQSIVNALMRDQKPPIETAGDSTLSIDFDTNKYSSIKINIII